MRKYKRARYGIAEWYGEPFATMSSARRRALAAIALGQGEVPRCPFQREHVDCSKEGGMCSMQAYQPNPAPDLSDRIGEPTGPPVIMCPKRFDQDDIIPKWLARIAGFRQVFIAREIPFMWNTRNDKAAGRIDIVLSEDNVASQWFGLEIQAVYFSGDGMEGDFEALRQDTGHLPPMAAGRRRPDWRSSGAKRLMPQLEVKVPTLRQWGKKLAVAVDRRFFDYIGGPSHRPSHDINEGDILWLVVQVSDRYELKQAHWEVLSLEESSRKLLAATTVKREEFEEVLRSKLHPL